MNSLSAFLSFKRSPFPHRVFFFGGFTSTIGFADLDELNPYSLSL